MEVTISNKLYFRQLKGYYFILPIVCVFVFLLISCSGKTRNAKTYLAEAEVALNEGNYPLAKLKIDSIKVLFPKSFDEINKGFELMQQIRMAENRRNITYCDSMLTVNYELLTNMLNGFTYVRDPQYQEFGDYVPKIYPLNTSFNQNGLRSAVSEKGQMYIESVLAGGSLRHNRIKVAIKDGSFAESLPVTTDGLNYRFSTLNTTYEIVRFSGNDDNGVAKFIYTFKESPITLSFIGNRTTTITLSETAKKAIARSFELSTLLLDIEKLKYEKGRSEALIKYLESKR
ncbi:MAG TPA: hypothetical protein GXX42_14375 [Petrimonas sp.]|uniref:hypothetical protein n=1 Tax=Petrimonas sp. TaxID=2023866 RepID=UPI00177182D0|nr:hypothetical protein [Petrimonas sp.]MEA5042970.1 hypothetical protein [Petrimonas sp.]MEA5062906.1 hypothetical protein [Petrimonas sp.]HHV86974.1 hypothetical protein [Petrimonas sp.]